MPAQELVSIIIPAYNAEAYLAECLESALGQSHPAVDVILVDDGSSDGTLAIARRHAGVEVLAKQNGGAASARNLGLRHASGAHVVFLDADDRLHPDALARHFANGAGNPGVAMVVGAGRVIDASGAVRSERPLASAMFDRPEQVALDLVPCPSQCMYRRSVLLETGGYNEDMFGAEDSDLNLRVMAHGAILTHPEIVFDYRVHGNNISRHVTRVCDDHMGLLGRYFGPGGPYSDRDAYRRISRRWKAYYGPLLLIEAIRMARRLRVPAMAAPLSRFAAFLPYSALGTWDFLRRRR